ncbi:MAG: hypothetical protein RL701_336, partial [Pseudomonadota bacterium]
FLARFACSEEAYLFRFQGRSASTRAELLAAVPEQSESAELGELVVRSVVNMQDDATLQVSLPDVDSEAPTQTKRFRIMPLRLDQVGAEPIGAVVIREGAETLAQVPASMLSDLTRALSEQLRPHESGTP